MNYKNILPGNTSMEMVREQNLLFVDKTRYIAWLENGAKTNVPVFMRPRRFGKTSFTVLLNDYYDIARKASFEENFADTWIGAHKTARASSYCCLSFDFSIVSSKPGQVLSSFIEVLASGLRNFSIAYPDFGLPIGKLDPSLYSSPSDLMIKFFDHFLFASGGRVRLYVIIDEYDHFANEVLSRDKAEFRRITSTAEDNEGFIKQFYACLKAYFGGDPRRPIEKFFITGVSSVSLDSITSGFNIANDISGRKECAAMVGLTHGELSQAIDETVDFSRIHGVDKAGLIEVMERLFDGYLFSDEPCVESVFNTDMCLNYLNEVIRMGRLPDRAQDIFISADSAKLRGMMNLAEPSARDEVSNLILARKNVPAALPERLNLNQVDYFYFNGLVSLLKYLGYLSFAKGSGSAGDSVEYRCPNEVYYQIFVLYCEGRCGLVKRREINLGDMASKKADIAPLLRSVEEEISDLPDTGFAGFNEKTLQMCFNFAVRTDSSGKLRPLLEADTGGHGRADLVVMNSNPAGRNFLFELKYIPKSKRTDAAVAAKLEEAKAQIREYKAAPNIAAIPRLDCWAIVFSGDRAAAFEKA